VLNYMWVYIYKFDKYGRLVKCKARLVVRGDQQISLNQGDMYTIMLAIRSFCTFIAIATCFDLEMARPCHFPWNLVHGKFPCPSMGLKILIFSPNGRD
jgi:hypothetical protein